MPESFDIFDTLITRTVGDPHAIFDLCAERLVEARLLADPAVFRPNRIEAERRRRFHAPNFEVTLAEIYETLAPAFHWDAEAAVLARECEIAVERACWRPINRMLPVVAQARRRQGAVWFISDTYLPAALLEADLREFGFFRDGDALFASCELRASKHSGRLWDILPEGRRPAHHTGNDAEADVRAPRRKGIPAAWLPSFNPNRYEAILSAASGEIGLLAAYLAGASRLTRLESDQPEGFSGPVCGVAAPVLVLFVLWALHQADATGAARLHFLSRDGQVLHHLARALQPRSPYNGPLNYLHGGRKVWYLARSRHVDDFLLDFLLECPDGLTPAMVASRSGLAPEVLLAVTGGKPSAHLDEPARERLRDALRDGPLRDQLLQQCSRQRDALIAYLRQCGFGEGRPCALVDVGWTGKSLRCFQEILREADIDEPMTILYFGRLAAATQHAATGIRTFLFDDNLGPNYRAPRLDPLEYTRIIENFCVSSQDPLDGFAPDGQGQMQPQFVGGRNQAAMDWGLPAMRALLDGVVAHLPHGPLEPCDHVAAAALADRLVACFFTSPDPEEAAAWARFPIETDATGAFQRPWARPMAFGDGLRLLRRGYLDKSSTHWGAASRRLTPLHVRAFINGCGLLRATLSLARHRLKPRR